MAGERNPEVGEKVVVGATGAVGTVKNVGKKYIVTLHGSDGSFSRADILTRDEVYVDSRGVQMTPMSFSEALEMIQEIADAQYKTMKGSFTADARRLQGALDTMADTVTNHSENIDDTFAPPVSASAWPDDVVGSRPDLDPEDPVSAIRICLALALGGINPGKAARDVAVADAIDRQLQSCDLTKDFLGLYSADMREKITVVPTDRM